MQGAKEESDDVSRGTVARAYVLAAVTHATHDAAACNFCGGMLAKPVQVTSHMRAE